MNQLLTKIKITTVLYSVAAHVFEKKQELLMYSTVFVVCILVHVCMCTRTLSS